MNASIDFAETCWSNFMSFHMRGGIRLALSAFALFAVASPANSEDITVGFWNVQNLFDEFSDGGHPKQPIAKPEDLVTRLERRARVIKDLNCDILGLSEVENRRVLRRLV